MRPCWRAEAWVLLAVSLSGSCRPAAPEAPPPSSVVDGPGGADPKGPASADAGPTATAAVEAPSPPPTSPLDVVRTAWAERTRAPLVSDDGRVVAIAPRSYEDLDDPATLLAIVDVDADRAREVVERRGHAAPDNELAGFARANAVLHRRTWTPLPSYDLQRDDSVPERVHGLGLTTANEASGEGLLVRFHEPLLTITDSRRSTVLRRAFPAWSHAEKGCAIFAYLGDVWASRKLGVMVVAIRYGTSPAGCGLDATFHAVRFARAGS